MTYKIKSLIYFLFFMGASTMYYVMEEHQEFQQHLQAKELVETDFEESLDEENNTEELELAQE